MRTVLVRYKVREGRAEENAALIHAVFDELRELAPAGLRYNTFRAADGLTFFHLATVDTPDGKNPLDSLESFKRFQQGIPDRCEELPALVELSAVDGYAALGLEPVG